MKKERQERYFFVRCFIVRQKQIGFLCIALTTVLFSLMEIALKGVSVHFHPFQMNFTRFFIGALVLLPFALYKLNHRPADAPKLTAKALGKMALLGFIGIFISMTFYQLSVMRTDASVVAILFSSNPLFVMLFASMFLGEPIRKHNVAALVLELLGILVIVSPWDLRLDAGGVLFVFIAVLTFALYGVLGKKEGAKYGAIVTTCFGFFFGSIEMMAAAALTHVPRIAAFLETTPLHTFANVPFFTGYSPEIIPAFLFVCIGVTGIGFASYFLAMEYTSAAATSLVFFLKPVLATVFAVILIGEEVPGNRVIGIVIIVAASLVNLTPVMQGLLAGQRRGSPVRQKKEP